MKIENHEASDYNADEMVTGVATQLFTVGLKWWLVKALIVADV